MASDTQRCNIWMLASSFLKDCLSSLIDCISEHDQQIKRIERNYQAEAKDKEIVLDDSLKDYSSGKPQRKGNGSRKSCKDSMNFGVNDLCRILPLVAMMSFIADFPPPIQPLILAFLICSAGIIRPPDRVKTRMRSAALIAFMIFSSRVSGVAGYGAGCDADYTAIVGQPVNMALSRDIPANYTMKVERNVNKVCAYDTASVNTTPSYLDGVSCLRKGISFSSVESNHAGTYNVVFFYTDSRAPTECNFRLKVEDMPTKESPTEAYGSVTVPKTETEDQNNGTDAKEKKLEHTSAKLLIIGIVIGLVVATFSVIGSVCIILHKPSKTKAPINPVEEDPLNRAGVPEGEIDADETTPV